MMQLAHNRTFSLTLLLLGGCLLSATTTAESVNDSASPYQQLSRYRLVLPTPTQAQRDPLQVIIKPLTLYNANATVGSAIKTILKDSGYRLTSHHPDGRIYQLLALPLPKVHQNMGPITLEKALATLAGRPWVLAVDPIHRLISFQLPFYYKTTATGT